MGSSSLGIEVPHKVAGQVCGVGRSAVDEARLSATQERHTDEIEAGAGGHTAVVADAALPIEYRDLEPRKIRPESGGPQDRPDLAGTKVEGELRRCRNLGGGESFWGAKAVHIRFGRPC